MSNVRFLVFSGGYRNEGNFAAIESESSIIIVGAGINLPLVNQSLANLAYLEENRAKVKGIVVNNLSLKNTGIIERVYKDLAISNLPIFGSRITKTSFSSYHNFSRELIDNFVIVDWPNEKRNLQIGDFLVSFFSLDSYLPGNLGFVFSQGDSSFYYIEDFSLLNNLSDNNNFSRPLLNSRFQKIASFRKRNNHLVVGCQNLEINNNRSSLLEIKKLTFGSKRVSFLLYSIDLLRIFEIIDFARSSRKRVNVIDPKMFSFLSEIFLKDSLARSIVFNKNGDDLIDLFTIDVNNFDSSFESIKKSRKIVTFASFLFTISGFKGNVARLFDLIYLNGSDVIDLSKTRNISLGTNLYDLKFLINTITPDSTLLLQTIYKDNELITKVKKTRFYTIKQNNYFDFSEGKIDKIKSGRQRLGNESLLFFQREKMLKSGLLVFVIVVHKTKGVLTFSNLTIKPISISSTVDTDKLKKKIFSWWEKNSSSFDHDSFDLRQEIERRLSVVVKNHLLFNNDIELEDPLFLTFVNDERSSRKTAEKKWQDSKEEVE